MSFGHLSILEPHVAVYILHLLVARILYRCIVLPTVLLRIHVFGHSLKLVLFLFHSYRSSASIL